MISHEVDFRTSYTQEYKGHFIMIKGSVHPEDITILNMKALNNRASIYINQKLIKLKRGINKSTIILGNFLLQTLI